MTTAKAGAQLSSKPAAVFATTHWSVVLAAGRGEDVRAADALEQLCRTYWYPLYAHVRRRGYSSEDAQDLTQEFFARLLAKKWLSMANARRGRFRSFLLAALNHFLANEWDRAHCVKRGGGQVSLPFDTVRAEQLYLQETHPGLNPDEIYERTWALQFLEHVRTRLCDQYAAQGDADRFSLLERFLPGEEPSLTYAQAASQLGIPEGTFKSDVHRFKQRYGRLLREQIAEIVGCPDEIDEELRHLIRVLGR